MSSVQQLAAGRVRARRRSPPVGPRIWIGARHGAGLAHDGVNGGRTAPGSRNRLLNPEQGRRHCLRPVRLRSP